MLASSAGFQSSDPYYVSLAMKESSGGIPAQGKLYRFDDSNPVIFFVRLRSLLYDKPSWDNTYVGEDGEICLADVLRTALHLVRTMDESKIDFLPDDLIIINRLKECLQRIPRSSGHELAELVDEALDKAQLSESELAEIDHQACISDIQQALRFVLKNESENAKVAESVSNALLLLRNAGVVGVSTLLLTLITSAVEGVLPEDTMLRTQIAIAFSLGASLLLKVVGILSKYIGGECAWKDVALDATAYLFQLALLVYMVWEEKLDELTSPMVGITLSKAVNQILANTIVIESVKAVTDDELVVETDHPIQSIVQNSAVAGTSTAVAESYAFHDDDERKFYEYAYSEAVNAVQNAVIATGSNTVSDIVKRWAKNCWNGSHDRLRISVHRLTAKEWLDILTNELGIATIWAQNKSVATALAVSKMPDDKWIRTVASTITSLLVTASETTLEQFKSKPLEILPASEEERNSTLLPTDDPQPTTSSDARRQPSVRGETAPDGQRWSRKSIRRYNSVGIY
ncbi:MAG: hypothetical protein JWP38_1046 [Herbaspirillum sp.]|jgi:hypothetical protein|nr:hypothetical protein [Herbaspirillum sp.]